MAHFFLVIGMAGVLLLGGCRRSSSDDASENEQSVSTSFESDTDVVEGDDDEEDSSDEASGVRDPLAPETEEVDDGDEINTSSKVIEDTASIGDGDSAVDTASAGEGDTDTDTSVIVQIDTASEIESSDDGRATKIADTEAGSDTMPETGTTRDTETESGGQHEHDRLYEGACRVEHSSWSDTAEVQTHVTLYEYDVENDRYTMEFLFEGVQYTKTVSDSEGRIYLNVVDSGYDGVIDSHVVYEYDEHGNVIHAVYTDSEGEEHISVMTNEYDDQGRLIGTVYESSDSYSYYTYTYTDTGRTSRYETDNGKDGSIDSASESTYDLYDNQTYYWTDGDNDGVFDSQSRREYTYDDDGRMLSDLYDNNADGTYEMVREWEYTDTGDISGEWTDYDGDGEWEWISTYEYDSDGFLISRTTVDNTNGHVASIIEFEADSFGNPILEKQTDYDELGDVMRTTEVIYSYDCW